MVGYTDAASSQFKTIVSDPVKLDSSGELQLDAPNGRVLGEQVQLTLKDMDGYSADEVLYQWQRKAVHDNHWHTIEDQQGATYTLEADDAAHFVRAKAFYTDHQGYEYQGDVISNSIKLDSPGEILSLIHI